MTYEQQMETSAMHRLRRPLTALAALSLLGACSTDNHASPNTLPPIISAPGPTTTTTTAFNSLPASTTTTMPPVVIITAPETTTTLAPVDTLPDEVAACEFKHASKEATMRFDDEGVHKTKEMFGRLVEAADHDNPEVPGECYKRIVFRFAGGSAAEVDPPGWDVRYVDAPTYDASGEPVEAAGTVFLLVTYGAWTYGEQGGDGPQDIPVAGLDFVQSITMAGNHEGVTNWVIGLDQRHNFAVYDSGGTDKCSYCIVVDIGDPLPEQP